MYTVDLSPRESLSNKQTTIVKNRKRKADSPPPPPEIEITKTLSREDKIEIVSLSDSEDDELDSKEDDNALNTYDDGAAGLESNSIIPNPSPPPTSSQRQVSEYSPQRGMNC